MGGMKVRLPSGGVSGGGGGEGAGGGLGVVGGLGTCGRLTPGGGLATGGDRSDTCCSALAVGRREVAGRPPPSRAGGVRCRRGVRL